MKRYEVYFWFGDYENGYRSSLFFTGKTKKEAKEKAEVYLCKSKLNGKVIAILDNAFDIK